MSSKCACVPVDMCESVRGRVGSVKENGRQHNCFTFTVRIEILMQRYS